MDIVVWLRSLGLGKYEVIFRENDIDETVLPSLTHENLKELGVASFGHRVKLLDAIAAPPSNDPDYSRGARVRGCADGAIAFRSRGLRLLLLEIRHGVDLSDRRRPARDRLGDRPEIHRRLYTPAAVAVDHRQHDFEHRPARAGAQDAAGRDRLRGL